MARIIENCGENRGLQLSQAGDSQRRTACATIKPL
jgi:hypothetical protein